MNDGKRDGNVLSDFRLGSSHPQVPNSRGLLLAQHRNHHAEIGHHFKEKSKSTPRPGGSVWLCFDCFKKNDLTLMSIEQANGSLETVEEKDS